MKLINTWIKIRKLLSQVNNRPTDSFVQRLMSSMLLTLLKFINNFFNGYPLRTAQSIKAQLKMIKGLVLTWSLRRISLKIMKGQPVRLWRFSMILCLREWMRRCNSKRLIFERHWLKSKNDIYSFKEILMHMICCSGEKS